MSAEIVAVGTEILLGGLVDTNTAWLSRRLAAAGVAVYRHTTVGDNKGRLVATLSGVAARADLVVCTGGLGPTSDDLTHELITAYSQLSLCSRASSVTVAAVHLVNCCERRFR